MRRPPLLDSVLERTAAGFLRRIHRVTHGTPVKLRAVEKQRVLVVAPHPDDEVIAAGGTLALHQRAGSEVLTLFVTLDAPAADGSIVRKGEAERAGPPRRETIFTSCPASASSKAVCIPVGPAPMTSFGLRVMASLLQVRRELRQRCDVLAIVLDDEAGLGVLHDLLLPDPSRPACPPVRS